MLTMGSLFDGIGGFPLAAIHHGVIPIWASEIEDFPIAVTKIRFPQMLHVGDITKLDGAVLPPVDVICGGSPCQDLSVAGARRGLAGERSGLFMEQTRIAKEMRKADEQRGTPSNLIRPRYLVWENVPGAFSSAEGEDFRAVLEEIIRIKDGTCDVPRPDTRRWESAGAAFLGDEFSLAWRVLDAQYWGVAQRRRRIFLVADFGGRTAPQILFEQDRLFGNPQESRGTWQGITTPASGSIDDPSGDNITSCKKQSQEVQSFHVNQRDEVIDLNGISGALLATRTMQMQTFVTEPLLCLKDHGGQRMDITKDIIPTLRAGMGGHQPLIMATGQGGAEIGVGICPTITASAGLSGNNQPVLFENHPKDGRYNGPLGVAPTLAASMGTGGNNVPIVGNVGNPIAYSLDAKESNSMKSLNPHAGCRQTEVARTIDTTNPNPNKNQGGIAILQEAICIAGNTIDREPQNGGNGLGCQSEIAYTLTATDRHSVFNRQGYSGFSESEIAGTQCARQHKDATDLITTYQEVVGTICSGDEKGIGNQYVEQDKCIVEEMAVVFGGTGYADFAEGVGTLTASGGSIGGGSENLAVKRNLVRRLTPLECECLQGFPDGWTRIPGASDTARYKALGNSVAIPCVDFILKGIAYFLQKFKEE